MASLEQLQNTAPTLSIGKPLYNFIRIDRKDPLAWFREILGYWSSPGILSKRASISCVQKAMKNLIGHRRRMELLGLRYSKANMHVVAIARLSSFRITTSETSVIFHDYAENEAIRFSGNSV